MNGQLLKSGEFVFLISHGLDNPSIGNIKLTVDSYDEDNDGIIDIEEFSKIILVFRNYRDREMVKA